MRAACEGQWVLFDSLDPRDHAQARALCATCPMYAQCVAETRAMQASLAPIEGTWAGVLFGSNKVTRSVGNCPQCGAKDGQRCVSPQGNKIGTPHNARAGDRPTCKACKRKFLPSGRVAYCSEECATASRRQQKSAYEVTDRLRLKASCADCGAPTSGTRCVRCTAQRANRIRHGREVAA